MQNDYVESFKGRMRDKLLNESLFFGIERSRKWCPWPGSNQHSLRNSILSRARLPIPPQGHVRTGRSTRAGRHPSSDRVQLNIGSRPTVAGSAVSLYEGLPKSKVAMLRRLYDWTMSLARTRHAESSLAAVSFVESSFFPIPPDVLLIPMVLSNRAKWFRYALVCTVTSVLGALLGYL